MTNAKIEAFLKEDIKWTIDFGPGWDPSFGAGKNGEWHRFAFGKAERCGGVCAIGALCVRRQPKLREPPAWSVSTEHARKTKMFRDVASASVLLGRKFAWVLGLYWAVGWVNDEDSSDWDELRTRLSDNEKEDIIDMARRLVEFAAVYSASDEHFLNESVAATAYLGPRA